jgi:hypothetical protein
VFWSGSAAGKYLSSMFKAERSVYLEIEIAVSFPGDQFVTDNSYAIRARVLGDAADFRNDCGTHYITATGRVVTFM